MFQCLEWLDKIKIIRLFQMPVQQLKIPPQPVELIGRQSNFFQIAY